MDNWTTIGQMKINETENGITVYANLNGFIVYCDSFESIECATKYAKVNAKRKLTISKCGDFVDNLKIV